MFSAVKIVAAAAIVALFGGFLLSGVVTTPQDDGLVPAAPTEPPIASDPVSHDAVIVDGRGGHGVVVAPAQVTREGDRTLSVGAHYQMELTEMNDPRLNGTFQIVWNEVTYDGIRNVVTASNRIDNELGSWVGVERGYEHPIRGWNWQGLYEGRGAYAGLSALLFWEDGPRNEAHGVIFPGTMPEALDPPEAPVTAE